MEDQIDEAVRESTVDSRRVLIGSLDSESRCQIDSKLSPSSPIPSDDTAGDPTLTEERQVELPCERSNELVSDCIDERFRVDRRKLERLLQGRSHRQHIGRVGL
jgi:hypothetical protein